MYRDARGVMVVDVGNRLADFISERKNETQTILYKIQTRVTLSIYLTITVANNDITK